MSDAAIIWALAKQATNQDLLVETLRAEGYQVEVRRDPREVESAFEDVPPAIVIIDIDGYDDTIWEISTACAALDIAVLVLTSADGDQVRHAASGRGVSAVREKPIQKAVLRELLQKLV